jgi:hypothetical protein
MSNQTAPIPGATIPNGFKGTWEPPASYGVRISPTIVVPSGFWTADPGDAYPQFATNLGQQYGKLFFKWGTWIVVAGTQNGGYLGNPYDPSNRYGAPAGAAMIQLSQVTSSWDPILGQDYVAAPPPPAAGAKTPESVVANAIAQLQGIKW